MSIRVWPTIAEALARSNPDGEPAPGLRPVNSLKARDNEYGWDAMVS